MSAQNGRWKDRRSQSDLDVVDREIPAIAPRGKGSHETLRWRKVDSKRRSRAMARSGPRCITRYPAGYAARGQVPRLTALSPARRDDMIERIHSAVTVTPPPTNLWALLAFRESCAAKSSCATYGQPGNCRTPDLPSAA